MVWAGGDASALDMKIKKQWKNGRLGAQTLNMSPLQGGNRTRKSFVRPGIHNSAVMVAKDLPPLCRLHHAVGDVTGIKRVQ
jgi:hypothetical protein